MLTKIKVYACDTVKMTHKKQKKIQTGGRAPGAPVLDQPFVFTANAQYGHFQSPRASFVAIYCFAKVTTTCPPPMVTVYCFAVVNDYTMSLVPTCICCFPGVDGNYTL